MPVPKLQLAQHVSVQQTLASAQRIFARRVCALMRTFFSMHSLSAALHSSSHAAFRRTACSRLEKEVEFCVCLSCTGLHVEAGHRPTQRGPDGGALRVACQARYACKKLNHFNYKGKFVCICYAQDCTFKPAINPHSEALMAERSEVLRENHISPHEQLFQDALRRRVR